MYQVSWPLNRRYSQVLSGIDNLKNKNCIFITNFYSDIFFQLFATSDLKKLLAKIAESSVKIMESTDQQLDPWGFNYKSQWFKFKQITFNCSMVSVLMSILIFYITEKKLI